MRFSANPKIWILYLDLTKLHIRPHTKNYSVYLQLYISIKNASRPSHHWSGGGPPAGEMSILELINEITQGRTREVYHQTRH